MADRHRAREMVASDLVYFGLILSFFAVALARTHENAGAVVFRDAFLALPLAAAGIAVCHSTIGYRDLTVLLFSLCAIFASLVANIEAVATGGIKAFLITAMLLVMSAFRAGFDASRMAAPLVAALLLFVAYNLYFYVTFQQFGPAWTWFIFSGAYENQNGLAIILFCGILLIRLREHLGARLSKRLIYMEIFLATLIILTQSRATLLAVAIFYTIRYGAFNRRLLASACLIGAVVGALLYWTSHDGTVDIASRFLDRFQGDVTSHRIVFWGIAFGEIMSSFKNLFFGVGINSFTIEIRTMDKLAEVSVHNAFINALLNYGVVGLVGLIAVVGNGIIRAHRWQRRGLTAALAAIAAHAMFESNLYGGLTITSFILALYLFTSGAAVRRTAMAQQRVLSYAH